MLMRFRVIFVESQKWEMMIVNNDAFFASVIDLLREGKRVTIPVKGTSMLPFIVAERDLVVLEGIEATSPAGKPRRLADRGDVVLFRFNNHYVLHRVLDFAAGGDAVIQGDGVFAAKEHCTRDEIYARVVSILKDGTRPVDVTSKIYILRFGFGFWPLRSVGYFLEYAAWSGFQLLSDRMLASASAGSSAGVAASSAPG